MLSDEGVVKVADLGLVKIPDHMDPESEVGEVASTSGLQSGTEITMQGTAIGTPAYMAPEQSADAAMVDHRADIYSLGCTLFYLLAGKPPFGGTVVSEVMEQHASQPPPNLAEINQRVPRPLQLIVERAMAKRPQDRYPSAGEMIKDLESYLGICSGEDYSPSREQADQWEAIAERYAEATPLARLAGPLTAGLLAVSVVLTLVMPMLSFGWVLLGPAMLVTAVATATLFGASVGQSVVALRARAWISSLSWMDYGIGGLVAVLFLLVVLLLGLWPGMICGIVLGASAGAAYHFLLFGPTQKASAGIVGEAERFVRDLRIDGADEDGVRLFAARYGGRRWQGLFESIFGYDALCAIRERLRNDRAFSGSTSDGALRDRLCGALSNRAIANRAASDHRRLAKVEQRGLQNEGMSAAEAKDRAWQMAAAIMDHSKVSSPVASDAAAAEQKRRRIKAMLADARSGRYKKKRDPLAPVRFVLGGQSQLLAGCLILALFAIAGRRSGLFDSLQEMAVSTNEEAKSAVLETMASHGRLLSQGIAGLLLCMSAFVSGWRMTPFAAIATAIIFLGPSFGIPGFGETIKPWMTAVLVGLVVYIPGILFGETEES